MRKLFPTTPATLIALTFTVPLFLVGCSTGETDTNEPTGEPTAEPFAPPEKSEYEDPESIASEACWHYVHRTVNEHRENHLDIAWSRPPRFSSTDNGQAASSIGVIEVDDAYFLATCTLKMGDGWAVALDVDMEVSR